MSGNSSGFFFAEKQQQQIQQNTLDPLGPNSDENKPFLYIITTCSNIQVMRIKEVITKDKMF